MSGLNYDEPATWPGFAQPILTHDFGVKQDFSTIVVGGLPVFRTNGPLVGVTRLERLPLGLTSTETVAALANADRAAGGRCMVVVDASANTAHAEAIARAFGPRRTLAVLFTGGRQHAQGPTPLAYIADDGRRTAVPCWNLSRTKLFEDIGLALRNGNLKITPTAVDRATLEGELRGIQHIVSEAGNVRYITPPGGHDDLAVSVAMLLWAAGRIGRPRPVRLGASVPFTTAAWT